MSLCCVKNGQLPQCHRVVIKKFYNQLMNIQKTDHNSPVLSAINDPAIVRLRHWRMFKDKVARHAMTFGGLSVIFAILLIFFYLLYVVFPLLIPASMQQSGQFALPANDAGKTLYIATEEKSQIAVRFTDQGRAIFFKTKDGSVITNYALPLPTGVKITSFAGSDASSRVVAFGLSDGKVVVMRHSYDITYPKDEAVITPRLEYPLGEAPIVLDEKGNALLQLALQIGEKANTLIAVTADHRLVIAGLTKQTSFIDESVTTEKTGGELALQPQDELKHLLLDKEQQTLYAVDGTGQLWHFDVIDKTKPTVIEKLSVVDKGNQVTSLVFLASDISLLIGDNQGRISQWFPVRNKNNVMLLTKVREFHDQSAPITSIAVEERRKGFAAVDNTGTVGIYHATAHRTLLVDSIAKSTVSHMAFSPRADHLLAEDDKGQIHVMAVQNKHPEISWSSLWGKVWYESYPEPAYIWQSSSASNDFEPKFSLTPLAFGTFKAAFYAMLIAVPLSILGAVYTAYFMSGRMRRIVKPSIEVMEALPTVILGFLAGLWLAPVVELNLPGIFMLFLFLPIGTLSFAYLWHLLPESFTLRVPEGWQAALLIPCILFCGGLAFFLSPYVEGWFFGGDMRHWLTHELGIGFDQRNALVVGIAMGLAVIPNIFSIAEDAIFSVPKHLTVGSLALGATPWQTMIRVVLLTASPGIFSALMIGMGRAVGETMIVLMATGNTPVLDFSIFQGLRTLSANIAVEMPESELYSTHYRVLFLAGFVLFMFTFFFNTLAEIVRQRLRRKYSSL